MDVGNSNNFINQIKQDSENWGVLSSIKENEKIKITVENENVKQIEIASSKIDRTLSRIFLGKLASIDTIPGGIKILRDKTIAHLNDLKKNSTQFSDEEISSTLNILGKLKNSLVKSGSAYNKLIKTYKNEIETGWKDNSQIKLFEKEMSYNEARLVYESLVEATKQMEALQKERSPKEHCRNIAQGKTIDQTPESISTSEGAPLSELKVPRQFNKDAHRANLTVNGEQVYKLGESEESEKVGVYQTLISAFKETLANNNPQTGGTESKEDVEQRMQKEAENLAFRAAPFLTQAVDGALTKHLFAEYKCGPDGNSIGRSSGEYSITVKEDKIIAESKGAFLLRNNDGTPIKGVLTIQSFEIPFKEFAVEGLEREEEPLPNLVVKQMIEEVPPKPEDVDGEQLKQAMKSYDLSRLTLG